MSPGETDESCQGDEISRRFVTGKKNNANEFGHWGVMVIVCDSYTWICFVREYIYIYPLIIVNDCKCQIDT